MIGMTLCSGIGAPEVAAPWVDWRLASEIEPFPRAVLQERFGYRLPEDHNQGEPLLWGDMTEVTPDLLRSRGIPQPDLIVAGTPCQDLSIGHAAGTGSAGLGFCGQRSRLADAYAEIVLAMRPKKFLWENVPNALSGRNAGGFLAFAQKLADGGYAVEWAVIDGADAGPSDQPRRRLYMVGHRGAMPVRPILVEREGHCGDRRKKEATAPVLTARGGMAFDDRTPCILDGRGPRIATPLEWERAMGFPDGHTAITHRGKPAADGPRYKAIGNSMAVPVIRWIMDRMRVSMGAPTEN